jgi:hypothetical protein
VQDASEHPVQPVLHSDAVPSLCHVCYTEPLQHAASCTRSHCDLARAKGVVVSTLGRYTQRLVGKSQGPAHLPLWQCSPMHGHATVAGAPWKGRSGPVVFEPHWPSLARPYSMEDTSHISSLQPEALFHGCMRTELIFSPFHGRNCRPCLLLLALCSVALGLHRSTLKPA